MREAWWIAKFLLGANVCGICRREQLKQTLWSTFCSALWLCLCRCVCPRVCVCVWLGEEKGERESGLLAFQSSSSNHFNILSLHSGFFWLVFCVCVLSSCASSSLSWIGYISQVVTGRGFKRSFQQVLKHFIPIWIFPQHDLKKTFTFTIKTNINVCGPTWWSSDVERPIKTDVSLTWPTEIMLSTVFDFSSSQSN